MLNSGPLKFHSEVTKYTTLVSIHVHNFLIHVLLFEKHNFPDTEIISQAKKISGRRAEQGVKYSLNHLPHPTLPTTP